MKTFKISILLTSLVLGIANQAAADLYQITFDNGQGDAGAGQIDVQSINNSFYVNSGYLDVTGGGAAGNWTLYSAGGATSYPGYFTSPAGAYWYDNAFYPSGVNPQYPSTSVSLDNYGLLFTQSNGNELNLWGNPDGSYTLGGNVGGWQNFNVQLSIGGTPMLDIVPVPEPTPLALAIFGGLVFTARSTRRFMA